MFNVQARYDEPPKRETCTMMGIVFMPMTWIVRASYDGQYT